MAGITLAQAETKLAEVMTAYENALKMQEYSIKDRSSKRARLEELQKAMEYWDAKVKSLDRTGSGPKTFVVTPY